MNRSFVLIILLFVSLSGFAQQNSQDVSLKTAEAYLERGISFASHNEWNRAIADFTEAIKLDNTLANAYLLRAISDHTQAIRLAPDNAVAYNNRAGDYHDIGDYDLAIADYNKSIMIDPNSSLTYGNRGNAYYEIGDYNRAIADYKAGLQIDPDNATLKKYLKYVQQLIDD